MKQLPAYAVILVGICLLGGAAYDEQRGIALESSRHSDPWTRLVRRQDRPERFRDIMQFEWLRGAIALCAGLVILGLERRMDRLDPFSPRFAGNAAIDDLDATLAQEQRRRKQPLK